MGADQSTAGDWQKEMAAKLPEVKFEKECVMVEGEQREIKNLLEANIDRLTAAAPAYAPRSTEVSLSATEDWQKQLMQDPKVA